MKNSSGLALTPMSNNPRLKVDWSKTFHISVRKPQFWLKNLSGLASTPMSVNLRLEVDL